MKCESTQFSDRMACARCNLAWDVNDPNPPKCGKSDKSGASASTHPPQEIPLCCFNPLTGQPLVHPCSIGTLRAGFCHTAWTFNPFFGKRRSTSDIISDPYGKLIVFSLADPLKAATTAGVDSAPTRTTETANVESIDLRFVDENGDMLCVVPGDVIAHPLFRVFVQAIDQAMHGKGERHGGSTIPFFEQQWKSLADQHGTGFLTGQAAKKLNEAASNRNAENYEQEVLGAIVYAGMALLHRNKGS